MEVYIIQNLIDILFIMVTGYIFTDNSFRYQFFYFFPPPDFSGGFFNCIDNLTFVAGL